jgi:hypothetical protein
MCSGGLGLGSLLTLKFSALLGSQTVNNLLGLLLLLLRVGQQLGLLIALTLNRRAISLSVASGDSGQFLSKLATIQNVTERTSVQFQDFQAEQAW